MRTFRTFQPSVPQLIAESEGKGSELALDAEKEGEASAISSRASLMLSI